MSYIFVTQWKKKSKLTTIKNDTKNEKTQVTKVWVNESRKEYNLGKNIGLDFDSDIPIIVINCLLSKNINKYNYFTCDKIFP